MRMQEGTVVAAVVVVVVVVEEGVAIFFQRRPFDPASSTSASKRAPSGMRRKLCGGRDGAWRDGDATTVRSLVVMD